MAREFTCGWEAGSAAAENTDGAGFGAVGTTGGLHLDGAGNGGSYHLVGASTNATPSRHRFQRVFARNLVEGWVRAMVKLTGVTANNAVTISLFKDTTEIALVRVTNTTGVIDLYRGAAATLLASSAAAAVPIGQYVVLDIHYRISDTVGLFEVFVDDPGTYTTPAVTFSGDTKPGADTTWNTIGAGATINNFIDEIGVNSITMRYDGGTGTAPTAGQTVTGGTSGATAVITAVEGDATSGVLVLEQWNGTAFQDNEPITTASLNALVNAPHSSFASGFEPNSKALGEGFVVHLLPSGAGATTQLTPSAGSNYQCVDETPPNTTDYVSSSTADQLDTYAAPSLPASATSVKVAGIYTYASRDGATINNYRAVMRVNGTNYFGVQTALSTSYVGRTDLFNVSPDTGIPFTTAEIAGAEPGFQVRT